MFVFKEGRMSSVARLAKPTLRGLGHAHNKRNLGISLMVSGICLTATYFLRYRPTLKTLEDFEKNYDPIKEYERMVRNGVFDTRLNDDDE